MNTLRRKISPTHRKFFRAAILLFVISLSLFVSFQAAFAKVYLGQEDETLYIGGAGEVIDEDLFIAGEDVSIAGEINGDIFVVGGRVVVDGNVNGDVFAAGGQMILTGTVADDVFVLGGDVSLDAVQVGGSLILGAGSVRVDDQSSVGGSMLFGGGTVELRGDVGGSVVGGAGLFTVDGVIEKDAYVGAGEIHLQSEAELKGNLIYNVEEDLRVADGAVVHGETRAVGALIADGGGEITPVKSHVMQWFKGGMMLWSFLGFLIIGLLMIHLFPKQVAETTDTVYKQPWYSLFIGLAVLVVVPVVMFLLAITVVGLQLSLLLGLSYFLCVYVTKVFVAVFYGDFIAKLFKMKKPNPYLMFAAGLLLIYLLKLIPIVGFFILLFSFLFVFGGLMLTCEKLMKKLKKGKA